MPYSGGRIFLGRTSWCPARDARSILTWRWKPGTGKTYCYVKTFFEMNKRYGWTKFIVVVPSIAIREGVLKSLKITAEHFTETYGKKLRFFAYNSKQLHHLERFLLRCGDQCHGHQYPGVQCHGKG